MDMAVVKSFVLTCFKAAPWVALAGFCAKGAWDTGNRMDAKSEKPVKPFKDIKNHRLSDYLPK